MVKQSMESEPGVRRGRFRLSREIAGVRTNHACPPSCLPSACFPARGGPKLAGRAAPKADPGGRFPERVSIHPPLWFTCLEGPGARVSAFLPPDVFDQVRVRTGNPSLLLHVRAICYFEPQFRPTRPSLLNAIPA